MKTKNLVIILGVIVALFSVFYAFQDGEDEHAYVEMILKQRREKEDFMRHSSASPFAANKVAFRGLNYFPVDVNYKIVATLNPIAEKDVLVLRTSDGNEEHYLKYAYAEFNLAGAKNKLLILEIMEVDSQRGQLFLAFGDETSARETYGAGRYLDLKKVPGSSTITLDFNLAYNPYCAYNDSYSCPLPPVENLLPIAIKAGEKTYE